MKVSVARDVGMAARGRRIDLGWSQDALAARSRVSRRWLSAFEAGKGSVELGMVLRVLAALDLELHLDSAAGRGHRPDAMSPSASPADDVDLDAFLTDFDADR